MPVARDAGHVTKNFPRAIKVPINQSTGTATWSDRMTLALRMWVMTVLGN